MKSKIIKSLLIIHNNLFLSLQSSMLSATRAPNLPLSYAQNPIFLFLKPSAPLSPKLPRHFLDPPHHHDSSSPILPSNHSPHHQTLLSSSPPNSSQKSLSQITFNKAHKNPCSSFCCFFFFFPWNHSQATTTTKRYPPLGLSYQLLRPIIHQWCRCTCSSLWVGSSSQSPWWSHLFQSQRPHWHCPGISY